MTAFKAELQEKVGRNRLGGILDFDVSDEKLASQFANVDHVHNYSWYIGNYPSLEKDKITNLLTLLNN